MKKISLLLIATMLARFSYGQTNTFPSNGNVGIGTTSPIYTIDVTGNGRFKTGAYVSDGQAFGVASAADYPWGNNTLIYKGYSNTQGDYAEILVPGGPVYSANIRLLGNGNVGIGTTTPNSKLDVEGGNAYINLDNLSNLGGQVTISNNYGNMNGAVRLNFNNGGAVSWIKGLVTGPNTNYGSALVFGVPATTTDGAEAMRISYNGNVGIGTTTPDAKLTVNGTTHTKEVLVDLLIYPDYVFKPTYHLPTLNEVKTYIDQNHHLPDMPTEAEVVKNGLKVGETEALLTKKVEELTLYAIEENKQRLKQEERNKQQQDRINQLEQKLEQIEQQIKITKP